MVTPKVTDPELANYPYDLPQLEQLGEHASMTERRADDATRDVMAWLKCEFLQDRVGEEFEGVISAVVPFGFFVALSGIYIEGLVHVSTLNGDYFHHDPVKHRLIGERTAVSFRLGDDVRVRVVRVGLEDRKIDLELVSQPRRRKADREALAEARRETGDKGRGGSRGRQGRSSARGQVPVGAVPAVPRNGWWPKRPGRRRDAMAAAARQAPVARRSVRQNDRF